MTIKDIAEHFGISISMVSRAINNSGYIREDLRKEIVEYAREHHWQPSKRAVQFKMGGTQTVGVVSPFINNNQQEFLPMLISRLLDLKYSWQFMIGAGPEKIDALAAFPVEMILAINITNSQIDSLRHAKKKHIPVLNLFGYRENIPSIYSPHGKAIYDCMKTLVQNGHRKIAYIGPDFRLENLDMSMIHLVWAREAMKKVLEDFDLDFRLERDCFFSMDYNFDREEIKKFLKSRGYTAVFGWTIFSQIAFYSACRELGMVIGKDISFVGFEGNHVLAGFNPPPTYYEFDYGAILDGATSFIKNKGNNFPMITETGFILHEGESIVKI